MRRLGTLVLVAAALLLGGCWATTDTPRRWNQLAEDQRATVFGSITAEMSGPSMSRYMIKFRNIGTREEGFFSVNPGMDSGGEPEFYERRRTTGALIDVAMPPGRYEFYDVWIVAASGFGSTEYSSRQPFSVPFTVEAGKANYIGELRAYPVVGRNIFGMTLAGGGYFVVRDQQARDTQVLLKRRGVAQIGPIKTIMLNPDAAGTPFMRSTPLPPIDTVSMR